MSPDDKAELVESLADNLDIHVAIDEALIGHHVNPRYSQVEVRRGFASGGALVGKCLACQVPKCRRLVVEPRLLPSLKVCPHRVIEGMKYLDSIKKGLLSNAYPYLKHRINEDHRN